MAKKTDLKRASELIGSDSPLYLALAKMFVEYEKVDSDLREIIGSNQNAGCGGDRKMSGEQWEALNALEDLLTDFTRDYTREMGALRKAKSKPFMDDEPAAVFGDDDVPF